MAEINLIKKTSLNLLEYWIIINYRETIYTQN